MGIVPMEIIQKKRDRFALSEQEIHDFVMGYSLGQIPDYQVAAWLMAVLLNGMDESETYFLTKAMLNSGRRLDFSKTGLPIVDKHSTGGVGDKTTLILAPIAAANGVAVPTIAGRGLGHTGGTLDKLEAIPGFSFRLDSEQAEKLIQKHQLCFMGQTEDICPADKKMYALRDVTATVESIPLICASIMSKKLAEGLDGLVLDVKFGSGAFMKTISDAEKLARNLMAIGNQAGKKMRAVISSMDQPLGRYVGNSLEIQECLELLKGHREFAPDTWDLSLRLAAHMLCVAGKVANLQDAIALAEKTLHSGAALRSFEAVVAAQGGNLSALPQPKTSRIVKADQNGYIVSINTQEVGVAGIVLGAGRMKTTDSIQPTAGFEIHKKIGSKIQVGEPLVTIYSDQDRFFDEVAIRVLKAFRIGSTPPSPQPLIQRELILD